MSGDGPRPSLPRWPVALVTGASSGLGEAFARRLAAQGSKVVLVARRRDRLEQVAQAAQEAGGQAEVLVADLTVPAQLGSVEERLRGRGQPVDLLVNNAGFGTSGPFLELPVDTEEEEIRLNVLALVRLTSAALPGMVERGRGAVLNVSSLAALQPLPYAATYAATKAFVTSFSEAVHEELRGTGVSLLALMPGFVRTEFQARSGADRWMVPGPMWMSSEAVVDSALAALARRRVGHVPGRRYQALAAVSRLTPWAVSRRVVALVSRGGGP